VSPHHDDERALSSSTISDPLERTMRVRRPNDPDRVSQADVAVDEHDTHDARPVGDRTGLVSADDLLEQPPPVFVDLGAGVAQSGDLDDSVVAKVQPRCGGQAQQVDAARRVAGTGAGASSRTSRPTRSGRGAASKYPTTPPIECPMMSTRSSPKVTSMLATSSRMSARE